MYYIISLYLKSQHKKVKLTYYMKLENVGEVVCDREYKMLI